MRESEENLLMDRFQSLLLVFVGGGVGACFRVLLDWGAARWWRGVTWPAGTLVINLLGCLLLGALYGWMAREKATWGQWGTPLLGAGLLGGFTTFSTFGVQTMLFLKEGRWGMALTYVLLSVLGGLALAAGGYFLTQEK